MMAKKLRDAKKTILAPPKTLPLLKDLRQMIEETRQGVAATVNTALTMLYWRIGKRLNDEILQGERAEYGKEIVVSLARQLEADYGRGFSEKSLRHMLRFAEAFPDKRIVSALMRQLRGVMVTPRREGAKEGIVIGFLGGLAALRETNI